MRDLLIYAKIKRLMRGGCIFKETSGYHDRRKFFKYSLNDGLRILKKRGEGLVKDFAFEELCVTDATDFCDYYMFFKLTKSLNAFYEVFWERDTDYLWDNDIDDKQIARFLLRNAKGDDMEFFDWMKPNRTSIAILILEGYVDWDDMPEDKWNLIRTDPMIAKAFDRYAFEVVMVENREFDDLKSYSNYVFNSSLPKYSRNPKMGRVQRFIRGDMGEVDAFLAKDLGAKLDGADLFIRRFLQSSFDNMPIDGYDENDEEVHELERKCLSKIMSNSNNFSRFVFRAINRNMAPYLDQHLSLLRFDVEPLRPVYVRRVFRILEDVLENVREDLILLLLRTGSVALIRFASEHFHFEIDHILAVKPDLEPRIFELLYEGAFVYSNHMKVTRDCFRRRPSDSDLERAYKSMLTGRPDPVPLLKCLLEKQIKCYKRKWMSICKEKVLAKIPRI